MFAYAQSPLNSWISRKQETEFSNNEIRCGSSLSLSPPPPRTRKTKEFKTEVPNRESSVNAQFFFFFRYFINSIIYLTKGP
jgi:hypothetical protein